MTLPFADAVTPQPHPLQTKYLALVEEIEMALPGFEKAQKIILLFAQMSIDKFDEASLRAVAPNSKIHSDFINVGPIVEMCKSADGANFGPNEDRTTVTQKDNPEESQQAWYGFLQEFSKMSEQWDLDRFRESFVKANDALLERRLG